VRFFIVRYHVAPIYPKMIAN